MATTTTRLARKSIFILLTTTTLSLLPSVATLLFAPYNKHKMVQGAGGLGKAKKSAGGARSKSIRAKKNATAKGKRKINRTTNHATLHSTADLDTTRDINRKNEVLVAAKAVSVGTKFFLTDINAKGKTEVNKQLRQRSKKQVKTKLSNRLKDQLQKLGNKDVKYA
jgi:hypothetical protein